MSNISFWHCGSNKPHATEFAIANVRKHHPNAYYHLCVDGQNMEEFYRIAKKYDCDFVYYDRKLGGPVQPYGYNEDKIDEFLSRFHKAFESCDTSHIMMMEDDVLILKPISVYPNWKHACHNVTSDNFFPEKLKDLCAKYGIRPNWNSYGAGGGSIFNTYIFLDSYPNVKHILFDIIYEIGREYPTIGWLDCFLNVFYYICGCEYSVNPHLTDTHNHRPGFDYDKFISNLDPKIEIVNNYKRLYFNE